MKIKLIFSLLFIFLGTSYVLAQLDSTLSKITFESDFRFRIEKDWDSKKSNGTFREDRSRLRYRFRTGATYNNDGYAMGFRIRTGVQNKQQDPQLTLGKGLKEFGTLPIGFEKIFFQGSFHRFKFWLGKNDYSFEKNNELFWSDNVFPEGIFIEHNVRFKDAFIQNISFKGSHYILSSNGLSFLDDAYFQGIQSSIQINDKRIKLFPSLYLLRNIPNIPDGNHSFELDYTIFHLGGNVKMLPSRKLLIDFDFYRNLEDYSSNTSISNDLIDQKTGYSFGLQYGNLQNAKNGMFKITYTSLQRFAALDYMAQNDWARWDYASFDSPDGRLTNLKGVEIVVGYNIHEKINLISKYYHVTQLIPLGSHKETGQRIRLDLNVRL